MAQAGGEKITHGPEAIALEPKQFSELLQNGSLVFADRMQQYEHPMLYAGKVKKLMDTGKIVYFTWGFTNGFVMEGRKVDGRYQIRFISKTRNDEISDNPPAQRFEELLANYDPEKDDSENNENTLLILDISAAKDLVNGVDSVIAKCMLTKLMPTLFRYNDVIYLFNPKDPANIIRYCLGEEKSSRGELEKVFQSEIERMGFMDEVEKPRIFHVRVDWNHPDKRVLPEATAYVSEKLDVDRGKLGVVAYMAEIWRASRKAKLVDAKWGYSNEYTIRATADDKGNFDLTIISGQTGPTAQRALEVFAKQLREYKPQEDYKNFTGLTSLAVRFRL